MVKKVLYSGPVECDDCLPSTLIGNSALRYVRNVVISYLSYSNTSVVRAQMTTVSQLGPLRNLSILMQHHVLWSLTTAST